MSESRRPLTGRDAGLLADSRLRFEVLSWLIVYTGLVCPLGVPFPTTRGGYSTSAQVAGEGCPMSSSEPCRTGNLLFSPTYGFTLWALPFQKVGLRRLLQISFHSGINL